MKSTEAEKLLGGYATGILTDAEQKVLFTAALQRQGLFDALADEEALRELLADPAAKAQLIAALAPAALPRVVPFWRRTGLLSAAAGLIMAATAGLVYLRNPDKVPPPLATEATLVPKEKAAAAPQVAAVPVARPRQTAPAPAPKPVAPMTRAAEPAAPPPPAASLEDGYRAKAQADYRRAEAQDKVARKVEASRPAATVLEMAGAISPASQATPTAKAMAKASVHAGGGARQDAAPVRSAPNWILEARPDGSTRVTVLAPRGPEALLLKRGAAGIEVVRLWATEDPGSPLAQWRAEPRLVAGDVLDLYLLNTPTADPARLPETGPVDGFRARIYPIAK